MGAFAGTRTSENEHHTWAEESPDVFPHLAGTGEVIS